MWRKVLFALPVLTFAFVVLFISILRTAAVKYEFSGKVEPSNVLGESDIYIDYHLAYPGKVLPDHPLWSVKALRDKIWLLLTTNKSRKAELNLLFADKRVGSSQILFEKGKSELAFSTLTKAEKYLEEALAIEKEQREKGEDTGHFLYTLANASLKHAEVIEKILDVAPEDAKPGIIELKKYPQKTYEDARNALLEKGTNPPECPFDWR
jgi:hypothetical protein